MATKLIGW